uniref:EGF-like domain-containing protein n=1 Tax=Stegastes partitus TaxID=144197 RepID=A0A3B5AUH1_9TELE
FFFFFAGWNLQRLVLSPSLQHAELQTLSAQSFQQRLVAGVPGPGGERHHVVKRMTGSCDSTFDNYCLNHGQCMLLPDCCSGCRCVGGYHGPRCGTMDFVVQPLAEEQVIVIVFCVSLLIIGLAGALYFCCKCPSVLLRPGSPGVSNPGPGGPQSCMF